MTPSTRKKLTVIEIGSYAGAILVSLSLTAAVYGFALKKLDERIDERIDKKTTYQVILLKKMATPEQLQAADEEFKRFGK